MKSLYLRVWKCLFSSSPFVLIHLSSSCLIVGLMFGMAIMTFCLGKCLRIRIADDYSVCFNLSWCPAVTLRNDAFYIVRGLFPSGSCRTVLLSTLWEPGGALSHIVRIILILVSCTKSNLFSRKETITMNVSTLSRTTNNKIVFHFEIHSIFWLILNSIRTLGV